MIPLRAVLLLGATPLIAPVARADDGVPIELRFEGGGTAQPIPYESIKGVVVFRAVVAGREVWGLLDNGSQASLVDEAFAREVGLALGPADGKMITPSGSMAWRPTRDVSLTIPGVLGTTLPKAATLDLSVFSRSTGRKIDFVLGRDLARLLVIWVDPGRKALRLAPSGALKPDARIPFLAVSGEVPCVDVRIGDAPARLEIDMGASDALILTPEAWARLAPGRTPVGTRASSNAQGSAGVVPLGLAPKIAVGPFTVDNVPTAIQPWPTSSVDGVLGMGLLGKVQLMLDIGQGKMWVLPPSPPEPPKPAP